MSYFIFDGVLSLGNQYELKGEEYRHIQNLAVYVSVTVF